MRFTILFAAVATLMACGDAPDGVSPAEVRPNIVYILADDLGYGELGSYGQKRITTPHMDRLAEEGMKFTQHYAGAPVCAPSRCVLLTGKSLPHAYIRDNLEVQPEGQEPLPDAEITIAERLQTAGYATAAIGKWGLGPMGSSGDPLRQGFDHFFGYNCQRHAHSYYPDYLWSDNRRIELGNAPPVPGHAVLPPGADPNDPASYKPYKGSDYTPDRMIESALAFIESSADSPFFLYYASPLPHLALHVPDEDLEPYLGRWDDVPFTGGRGYTPHQTPRAAYAAMISRLDHNVGQILARLQELGIAGQTLVIVSSDNGTTHLSREVDADFFASVGQLRGLKGSAYEGGIRVPMIARWPGKIGAGTTSDHISAFHDVMPTLCAVAGVQSSPHSNGVSFLPTLIGDEMQQRNHPRLVWEFHGYGGIQAVRFGNFKAVRSNCYEDPEGPIEIFDLQTDISEKHDLASQRPDLVRRSAEIMLEEHGESALWDFSSPHPETTRR